MDECVFSSWGLRAKQAKLWTKWHHHWEKEPKTNSMYFLLEITSSRLIVCVTRITRRSFSLSSGFAFFSGSVPLASCKIWDAQPPGVSPAARTGHLLVKHLEKQKPQDCINMLFHCFYVPAQVDTLAKGTFSPQFCPIEKRSFHPRANVQKVFVCLTAQR